jgi:Uma2 family endonuclease
MSSEPTVQTSPGLDPALLTGHPELAVLALDLPDSDGEPVENERESFQIDLLREALDEYWRDRQDFYVCGNMCLYYSTQQARRSWPRRLNRRARAEPFVVPTCAWSCMWMAAFDARSGWCGKRRAAILM